MNNYIIEESTNEDRIAVNRGIIEYNEANVPFMQDPPFQTINRVIKDSDGQVLAGINSLLDYWKCLNIGVLWVKEDHRKKGYGVKLLEEVEKIAKDRGCKLIYLDTFDFQAKDFYLKQGYEIFGVLDDCPEGHKHYHMKKRI